MVISPVFAEENYSLWPRRPEGLEQASMLEGQGKSDEAIEKLEPLTIRDDVIGKEARDLMGQIRIKQVLDPERCGAKKYRVQRGDGWLALAAREKCPTDMIVHLNQYTELPKLQPGQTILIKPLHYSLEIDMVDREIILKDGNTFIKAYPILAVKDTQQSSNVKTIISQERGVYANATVKSSDYKHFPASDKTIVLRYRNWVITGVKEGGKAKTGQGFYLSQADCNEISLLTRVGNAVSVIFFKKTPTDAISPSESKPSDTNN